MYSVRTTVQKFCLFCSKISLSCIFFQHDFAVETAVVPEFQFNISKQRIEILYYGCHDNYCEYDKC